MCQSHQHSVLNLNESNQHWNMRFNCVLLELVVVYWLTLVVSVVIPICLTWNTTDSFLTIKCIFPIAKYDIVIVDPFGNIRGQCILGESQRCIGSYKDDLLLEENFEGFTTLTLKTDKHNAEGEWKCRYGFEEKTAHVSYIEGIGPNIKVEISGEIRTTNLRNRFILSCFSCWTPDVDDVNIYVNGVWEDGIRYHDDLCYHKQNKCRPERCSCSAKGKNFTWTYISDLPYIKFTCSMMFKDTITSLLIRLQASLVYNGSALIQTQTTNMSTSNSHNFTIDADMDDQKGAGRFGYAVLSIVGMIILAILMICFWRIYVRRKKQAIGRDKKTKDGLLRSIAIGEDKMSEDEPLIAIGRDKKTKDGLLRSIAIGEDKMSEDEPLIVIDEDRRSDNEPLIAIGEDKMSEDEPLIVIDEDRRSDNEPLIVIHEYQNNQDTISPFEETLNQTYTTEQASGLIESQTQKASAYSMDHSFTLGKNMLSGTIFRSEEFKIYCICNSSQKEKEYTRNLIIDILKYGFQPENIKLINNAFPDNICSDIFTTVLKLIIVFPRKNELCTDNFVKLVEIAGRHFKVSPLLDILPIVRSKKTRLPLWLTNRKLFRRSGLKLVNELLHCPKNKTMDGVRNSLIIYQKRLNKIIISRKTCKHVANIGLEVLKGWGVELEKDRMSFRLNTLQSVSQYEPICLYDLVTCFVRNRSNSFLRFYGFEQHDLGDYKLHTHMHKQFIEIFKTFLGMRLNNCWYHYRRNGYRHRSSFEEYLRSIFLNETPSVMYQQFRIYEFRFRSFTDYPIENIYFREKLALAGFFYFKVSDYVQCFYCKGCLRAWNITDDPIVRHRENFKTCPFVMQPDQIVNPGKKSKPINNYRLDELKDRINSFKSFPVTMSQDEVQQLAVAGFYYYRIAVDIICLACNIGFADLRNVDDILKLHKQYSPQCPNIVMCNNNAEIIQTPSQKCISNFVRYLEFEIRKHDF